MAAINQGMPVVRGAAQLGLGAVISCYAYLSVLALAGERTTAIFLIEAIGDMKLDRWIA